jgi:hypothetical protein
MTPIKSSSRSSVQFLILWNFVSEFSSLPLVSRDVRAWQLATKFETEGRATAEWRGDWGGMSSTISGTCWTCVQVFAILSLDQRLLLRGEVQLVDESLLSFWHVMFASSCISETEEFDTWTNKFLMVIREHSSVTLACVQNNHWSDDQQVNALILNWYC